MAEKALVQARIEKKIKDEAAAVLATIGLTVSDAVRMMLIRVVAEKHLPFEPLKPNKITIAAMKEPNENLPVFDSIEELMADLHAED